MPDYFYVDEQETPLGDDARLAREFQTKLLDFVYGKDEERPLFGYEMILFNITGRFHGTPTPETLQHRCDTINIFVLDPANGA